MECEIMRQVQMITQNKAETARQMGVTRKTVDTVLKRLSSEEDGAVVEARRQSSIAISGKVHGKVDKILDSIVPADLESGKADKIDNEGMKYGEYTWGPSLLQKVTAGAILIDKLPVLAQYQNAIAEDNASGALPLPADVRALISGVQSKIKNLTILNVQFQTDNPDLSQRAQQIIAEAEIIESPEIIDFDNPGVPDAVEATEATKDTVDHQPGGVSPEPDGHAGPSGSEG
jgi:hypothetical protein